MHLKYLYIKKYKKFENFEVNFINNKESYLKKIFFGNLDISLLVGENGTGKTTILSFIAHIFRNLERYHERILSDFTLKYILDEQLDNEIIIKKEKNCIYISIDGSFKELLEFDYRRRMNSSPKSQRETITYNEIKKVLPSSVIISAFDNDYPKDYNWNYLGDKLVKIDIIPYNNSAFGMGISDGILIFMEKYFSDEKELLNIMNNMGFRFSEKIYVYRNYYEKIEELESILDNFYEEFGFSSWDEFLKKTEFKNKKEFLEIIESDKYWEKYCEEVSMEELKNKTSSEFEYNEELNIREFTKSTFYNTKLLSLLVSNGLIFINEFFIIKDGLELSLEKMSTGEKILLCRLFSILANIQQDSLVIIEEPEVHLNYSWVKQFISIIAILYKNYNSHFLISTHNHVLINNVLKNNILIVDKEQIKYPKKNTFLANERSINLELFEKSKIYNSFENKILKVIEKASKEQMEILLDNLGESYFKFIIFKKLIEFGDNNVENK